LTTRFANERRVQTLVREFCLAIERESNRFDKFDKIRQKISTKTRDERHAFVVLVLERLRAFVPVVGPCFGGVHVRVFLPVVLPFS
jgi:hypothetical protein